MGMAAEAAAWRVRRSSRLVACSENGALGVTWDVAVSARSHAFWRFM